MGHGRQGRAARPPSSNEFLSHTGKCEIRASFHSIVQISGETEGRRRRRGRRRTERPQAPAAPPPQVVASEGVNPYGAAAAPLRHGNQALMKCIFSDADATAMEMHIACGFLKLDWDQ